MPVTIPHLLAENCQRRPEWRAWLKRLPGTLNELERRWKLTLEKPFDTEKTGSSWVAPVTQAHGAPAVLKLPVPHMEGRDEIAGLRFWKGAPTVRVLEADEAFGAMLLESCEPGTGLHTVPEGDQDRVIAELLHRLWRTPSQPHPFRPLSEMLGHWAEETLVDAARWPDAALVHEGLRLFDELPRTAPTEALLATDLHAGNVLAAQREPWLVIDPKPFVGDLTYDATQHLLNCRARLESDLVGTLRRFSDLLEVDDERVRLWMFARVAAEPRDDWGDGERLARALVP